MSNNDWPEEYREGAALLDRVEALYAVLPHNSAPREWIGDVRALLDLALSETSPEEWEVPA
jgi:hypothetical protein